MSEKNKEIDLSILAEVNKKCKIAIKKNPQGKGWKLELETLTPECEVAFKEVSENLGSHGRKYLGKRLETTNPEVKKFFKKMDLTIKES